MDSMTASKGERIAAYVIDVIPAVILSLLFAWIPIIGAIIVGLLLCPYWLLRDVTGASIGKALLGLRVMQASGQEAPVGQRVSRNITLAIGPGLLVIPLLGYVLAPLVGGLIGLVEIVLVLSQNERLGDKIATTRVMKKAVVAAPPAAV